MNCWSNWLSCSDAAGALGGVEARRAWNSLIAGFGEVSPACNRVVLIDCATPVNVDDVLTVALPRAGHGDDEEQRHERGDADGGSEARRYGPHCLLRLRVGFVHEIRIERMAQRIGYRALELGVERPGENGVSGLAPRVADRSRSERGA